MDLSVIIVNYKAPQLLLDCLRSIHQFETNNIEIIVVDNFSGDNIEKLLMEQYPKVRFIQMGYNAGFARANNAGIKSAKGSSVLLLNSDTIIEDNTINKVYKEFCNSNFVACGVQLLNVDRTPQISGNFAMRGGLNYLLPLPFLGSFLKLTASVFNIKKPNIPDSNEIVEVDWINGAFLMVKKNIIQTVGILDEDFFLYAEEAEWCSRIKKAGKLCIYGQHKVIHLQGESANQAFHSSGKGYFNLYDNKGKQIMLSNFLRIRKEFGFGWFIFNLLIYSFEVPVFLLGILVSKIIFFRKNLYNFSQFYGYMFNVLVVWKNAAKILLNKRHFYKVL